MSKYHIVIEDTAKGVQVSVETIEKTEAPDNAIMVTALLYKALAHQVEHIKNVVQNFEILNNIKGEPNGN